MDPYGPFETKNPHPDENFIQFDSSTGASLYDPPGMTAGDRWARNHGPGAGALTEESLGSHNAQHGLTSEMLSKHDAGSGLTTENLNAHNGITSQEASKVHFPGQEHEDAVSHIGTIGGSSHPGAMSEDFGSGGATGGSMHGAMSEDIASNVGTGTASVAELAEGPSQWNFLNSNSGYVSGIP